MDLLIWLEFVYLWRLERKEKETMFGWGKPKDEKPSEEDYDLNAINELHSRAKDFVNVQDYTASDIMAGQRQQYAHERDMDVKWDRDTDSFRRRR